MKVINLVSKFITKTRGHPLAVTVPEAQLLHDFATWVDKQSDQHRVEPTIESVVVSPRKKNYRKVNSPA
jgi:hypothetical protein